MKRQWKDMSYSQEFDCWVVSWGDHGSYKVHCGGWFELDLGDRTRISCRIELGREWYVGQNNIKFNLKVNETYKVVDLL